MSHILNSRRCRLLIFILSICVCILMIFVPGIRSDGIIMLASTAAQDQDDNQQSTSSEIPANPSVSAVTQAAVKLGILSCVSRINQVATFLTADNQSGVFIFAPKKQPDKHIFSTSFELIRKDDSVFYASASFFPNQDAVYDTVEYVEKSCEELEKTVFANLKRISVIKKSIIVLNGGDLKVFLMPAGNGTVVIKKEVIK